MPCFASIEDMKTAAFAAGQVGFLHNDGPARWQSVLGAYPGIDQNITRVLRAQFDMGARSGAGYMLEKTLMAPGI